MQEVVEADNSFITDENPYGLPLERLAKVYALQKNASDGNLDEVKKLVREDQSLVHETWSAGRRLPLGQAVWFEREDVVSFLLVNGADSTVSPSVGLGHRNRSSAMGCGVRN